MQHLENVSPELLEEYKDIMREYVRGRHGLYALYRKKKLYYVGLASNLPSRVRFHLRDRHAGGWDRFSLYLTRRASHLRELEALLLRIASPSGNRAKSGLAHAQDLRKVFRQQVKEQQRKEIISLFFDPDKKPSRSSKKSKKLRLSDVIEGRIPIRMTYKGKTYSATVRRDGTIRFKGKIYHSPSSAAKAATKRPMRGWYVWKYETAPGEWVRLSELKR